MPKGLGFSEPRPSGQERTLDLRDICPNQECCDGLVTTTKVRLTMTKQPPERQSQRGGTEKGGILEKTFLWLCWTVCQTGKRRNGWFPRSLDLSWAVH